MKTNLEKLKLPLAPMEEGKTYLVKHPGAMIGREVVFENGTATIRDEFRVRPLHVPSATGSATGGNKKGRDHE